MIEVNHITYTYPGTNVKALDDLSFSIEAGKWVALIGHNGSGKSTISRIIDGLVDHFEGAVMVGGIKLTEETVWDVRDQIGFVFQNPDNQFVGATVQDDVAFGLENRNVPRTEMVQRVAEALKKVNMADFADREPSTLSGGQKQRVALAGAIALKPKVLILDEATSMLDPEGRRDVLNLLIQMRSELKLTIIMITHDIDDAKLADEIILMNNGQLVAQSTPVDLFTQRELLLQNGLSVPYSEQLKYELRNQGIDVPSEYLTDERMEKWLWQQLN